MNRLVPVRQHFREGGAVRVERYTRSQERALTLPAFRALKGARRYRPDSRYDSEQLAAGVAVEREHTNNVLVAKTIAKDHLDEDDAYYEKLAKVEAPPRSQLAVFSNNGDFFKQPGTEAENAHINIADLPEEMSLKTAIVESPRSVRVREWHGQIEVDAGRKVTLREHMGEDVAFAQNFQRMLEHYHDEGKGGAPLFDLAGERLGTVDEIRARGGRV